MKDVVKTNVKKPAATRPGTKHRRRRNLSLYYLLMFIVCVLVLFILSRTVLFNINEYTVNGTLQRYTQDQVLEAGNLKIGRNMYNLNLDRIEEKIKKTLIYIEDVQLQRKLPDRLIVNVTEAVAYACCEYDNGRYCIISRGGRYLETEQLQKREGLILVTGMELTGVALGEDFESKDSNKELILLDFLTVIDELCPNKITYIDITDRTNIKMGYEGRIDIEFGSSLDYEYKFKYITTIINDKLTETDTGTLIYHSAQAGASFISSSDLEKIENDMAANQPNEAPEQP